MPEVTLSCRNCRQKTRRSANCKKCPHCGAPALFRPKEGGHKIASMSADGNSVSLHLANGVQVTVNSNDGYLHVNFSGVAERPSRKADVEVEQYGANCVNLKYRPTREDYG